MLLPGRAAMKIVSIDGKQTEAVLQVQSAEDLWRLSSVLEPGDRVTSKTERKVKVTEDAVTRKIITLCIEVERVELQGDALRISGKTTEGLDDVPKGSYHTITISPHDSIKLHKEFQSWQVEKLKEADTHPILILLMDREEAVFAVLRREPEILSTIKGVVQKKGIDGGSPYWEELAKQLAEYNERIRPLHIIVASPAFFKEYVINILPEELKRKTVGATISATGAAALSELIRRPEVRAVLKEERYSQESALIDQIMEAIHQDKAAWGIADVEENATNGALGIVVVTMNLIQKTRAEGTYEKLAHVLKLAENTKSAVHMLETSASEQIDKLGGIAGVKRW